MTGGGYNKVTVYTKDGFLEDWPSLLTGRQWHACGHFVNMEEQMVTKLHSTYIQYLSLCQGVPGDWRLHGLLQPLLHRGAGAGGSTVDGGGGTARGHAGAQGGVLQQQDLGGR